MLLAGLETVETPTEDKLQIAFQITDERALSQKSQFQEINLPMYL